MEFARHDHRSWTCLSEEVAMDPWSSMNIAVELIGLEIDLEQELSTTSHRAFRQATMGKELLQASVVVILASMTILLRLSLTGRSLRVWRTTMQEERWL